jgi:hypothetical protein
MQPHFSLSRFWIVPFVLTLSVLCGAQEPMPEPGHRQETELGQEMYKELKAKGEIVESSPLYDTLKPIADSISRVAQSHYPHPFNSSSSTNPSQMLSRRQAATSMSWILCSTS